jgi:hypothetical protein
MKFTMYTTIDFTNQVLLSDLEEVDVLVEFEASYAPADPSVGIMDEGIEDLYITHVHRGETPGKTPWPHGILPTDKGILNFAYSVLEGPDGDPGLLSEHVWEEWEIQKKDNDYYRAERDLYERD